MPLGSEERAQVLDEAGHGRRTPGRVVPADPGLERAKRVHEEVTVAVLVVAVLPYPEQGVLLDLSDLVVRDDIDLVEDEEDVVGVEVEVHEVDLLDRHRVLAVLDEHDRVGAVQVLERDHLPGRVLVQAWRVDENDAITQDVERPAHLGQLPLTGIGVLPDALGDRDLLG